MIAADPNTHGSMFVPIILGSDKTTVSVATGHTEYWPVYLSIGNIHNNVRRAHRNGLVLLGFLAIPKGQSQELCVIYCLYTYAYISCEKICRQWWLSQFLAPITSYISREDPWPAQTRHDNSGSSTLPRWTFSMCHIWTRTVHRRLPWTVPSGLYRARVVSKVSLIAHKCAWSGLIKVTEGALHLHAISMEMRQGDVKRIQRCLYKSSNLVLYGTSTALSVILW